MYTMRRWRSTMLTPTGSASSTGSTAIIDGASRMLTCCAAMGSCFGHDRLGPPQRVQQHQRGSPHQDGIGLVGGRKAGGHHK